jgi:peroxiredoxin
LKGEIKGYGNGRIVIIHSLPRQKIEDTLMVVNDHFEYKGIVKSPYLVFFRILGNEVLKRPYAQGLFMIENADMLFKADVNDINNFTLNGSKTNDEFMSIYKHRSEKSTAFSKALNDYRTAVKNNEPSDALLKDMEEKRNAYAEFLLSIDGYANSHAIAYIIFNNYSNFPQPIVKRMLSHFSDEMAENVYVQYMSERIEVEENVKLGIQAPDFNLSDENGIIYSKAKFRGKYLLLTFTASWCTWCKKETPYLKSAYEHFGKEKLNILTVNLDKTRELWIDDMKNYPLPWPVVCDLMAFDGPTPKSYAIFAIPRIFLINPEGIIVGMNLRGDRIMEVLKDEMHK